MTVAPPIGLPYTSITRPLMAVSAHAVAEAGSADPLERASVTVRRMINVWRESGGSETGLLERDLVAERLARLGRWIAQARLPRLQELAGSLDVPELLGAGIYCRVILAMTPRQAAETVKFTSPQHNAAWVKLLEAM